MWRRRSGSARRRAGGGLSEADYVRMLLSQQVSGMVFAGGNFAEADSTHDHYRLLLERGVPAVLVNAAVDHIGFPRVSVDDAAAVEQAFGHLASLGHQRVGMVIGPDPPLTTTRQPIDAMGRAVVSTLVHQVEGLTVAPEELLFEPELVVRGSTAPATSRTAAGQRAAAG